MSIALSPVLEVEASVDDKPLAGQIFYIFENDPADLLKRNDFTNEVGYAMTMNEMRNHALDFLVINSQGKAEVTKLKAATYYICGISQAEQTLIWNVEISLLPGKNSLTLNSSNMKRMNDS